MPLQFSNIRGHKKKMWFLTRLKEGVGETTHKGWRWEDESEHAPLHDLQPMTQVDYMALKLLLNVRKFDGIKNDPK